MKILIPFLLIMSFACYGQDTIIGRQFPPMGFEYKEPLPDRQEPDSISDMNPNHPAWDVQQRLVTVEDLMQYAEECYNDSTIMFEQIPCPDKIVGCLVFHAKEYWHHREPTFSGLIQWLKKK